MTLTTRTKITFLFTSIVVVLIIMLNSMIFESANKEWHKKKEAYMQESMTGMISIDDARKKFVDIQVEDADGTILFQQGIFTHGVEHRGIASYFFYDPLITEANGKYYYWGIENKGDGFTYKTVDDVTDIITTRDRIVERAIWISVMGIFLVITVGYIFSGYILKPIQNMNEATRRFSLSEKMERQSVGIYGNIKDEVVILARSLEELFQRVNKEAERLEQFSDDIAHEIKNRLFEIGSSIDLALFHGESSPSLTKAKLIIKQLSNVVDALLFFARNEIREPKSTSPKKLLESELNFYDDRIQILGDDNVRIPLHPELFLTAVGNIVGNALKFTKLDGYVRLTVQQDRLSIEDNGKGIDKKDLPHIFDRLYRVDATGNGGNGHGLGLSISKKILEELHGFRLAVESEKGKGTIFTISWNTNI